MRLYRLVAGCVFAIISPLVTVAAPPSLLADLGTQLTARSAAPQAVSWAAGSDLPANFCILKGTVQQALLGLWVTDGTGSGTVPVSGLAPVNARNFVPVSAARSAAGVVLLSIAHPGVGVGLYALNLDTAHATLLIEGSGLDGLAPVGDRFLFTYDDGVHGLELWCTDGTPAGTTLLADLSPGPASSSIAIMTSNGARAWMSVLADGSAVRQLFTTNGTAQGTQAIGPITPNDPLANVRSSAAVGDGIVYAAAANGSAPTYAYFATNTDAPSAPLATSSGVVALTSASVISTGTHALFVGASLYVTDGVHTTALSSTALYFYSSVYVVPDSASPLGWVAYYPGGTVASSTEPCRTDGTPAGTYMIADLNPGANPSRPGRFVAAGGRAYFRTSTSSLGGVRYDGTFMCTDGTASGTVDLGDLPGEPDSATPLAAVGGQVLCAGTDARGSELWRYDPQANAFAFVADLLPGDASDGVPQIIDIEPNAALLTAQTPQSFQQFFTTDGTPSGTQPALGGGRALSALYLVCPRAIGRFGDRLAIFANDGLTGDEPWLIDPVSGAGTILADLRTGASGSQPISGGDTCTGSFTSAKVTDARGHERTVFAALPAIIGPGVASFAVWATDGIGAHTIEVSRHRNAFGNPPILFNFTTIGRQAYFFAPPLSTEFSQIYTELWVTDGTAAGTQRAVPLGPLGVLYPTQLTAWRDHVYFTGGSTGIARLYASDGTPEGTAFADLGPEASALAIGNIISTSLGLMFSAGGSSGLTALWITDNTPAGTRRLTADTHDTPYANIGSIIDAGTRVYFAMWTRSCGRELWMTDGTAAGTKLVADINPGIGSSDPTPLRVLDDHRLIFSAYTPDRGVELWQTDGTTYGTRLVADLVPGPSSSGPTNAALLGPNLIFAADDGSSVGRELWTVPLGAPCRCDADNNGQTQVDDVFAFLSLYFSGRGDFNGDGVNSVQDIFDFLGCWFGGCV